MLFLHCHYIQYVMWLRHFFWPITVSAVQLSLCGCHWFLLQSVLSPVTHVVRSLSLCIFHWRGDMSPVFLRKATVRKASVLPCKIAWHVKYLYSIKEMFVGKIHGHFSPCFSCLATRQFCSLLPESSGAWIRTDYIQMGKHNKVVMVAVFGTLCAIPPRNINSSRTKYNKCQ
jgi:hypothetical protein